MKKLAVYQELDNYEVREPGQGIPGNFEQGQWHASFDTYNEAKAYADTINNSHFPDLSERLMDTHRMLQMSREYLLQHNMDDDPNSREQLAIANIRLAMEWLEAAIEAL